MEAEAYQTSTAGIRDPSSILSHLDPHADVFRIIDDWQGIIRIDTRDGGRSITTIKRINKPLFTDECIQSIASDLKQFLNFTVQVSRFESDRIKMRVGKYRSALCAFLASHGDDHYISDESWKKIMDIHQARIVIKGEEVSGWQKFGFKWDYNKPVNKDMLDLVKDPSEEVDQSIVFRRVDNAIAPLLEASMSKSFAGQNQNLGMMLQALSEIRHEKSTIKEVDNKKSSQMFGGRQQENFE